MTPAGTAHCPHLPALPSACGAQADLQFQGPGMGDKPGAARQLEPTPRRVTPVSAGNATWASPQGGWLWERTTAGLCALCLSCLSQQSAEPLGLLAPFVLCGAVTGVCKDQFGAKKLARSVGASHFPPPVLLIQEFLGCNET